MLYSFSLFVVGELINEEDDASTDSRDPHYIISSKDFPTFLQLIVFNNKFYHGNEWVLQGLLNNIQDNIFRIAPKYLLLLLKSYNWDFTKISYYTKSKFFASIMRFNNIELAKLLFDKMINCKDLKGVESGLLYWCKTRNFKADDLTFLRIIKLIQSKFNINQFNILVQSALLKYTILRAAKCGDTVPFHSMLAYNLGANTLSHLYLHYTDFTEQTKYNKNTNKWSKEIFAEILHSLHHVKKFKFNVDNNTTKCFLFWSLKFELWETINELLLHEHHQKQIYSKFGENMDPFLHLICKKQCDYIHDDKICKHLCEITEICINKLYTMLNEQNKLKITNLMYAVQMLNIPLIKTILKYGPNLDIKDLNGNGVKWYIENNYWSINNRVIDDDTAKEEKKEDGPIHKITKKDMEQRKKLIYDLLRNAHSPSLLEEEFIEDYERRYDEFVLENESIPLYSSTKNDLNVLFTSIIKQDFQRIIDLIDKYNLDVNMSTIDGTTPLHFACEHSGALIIKFLIDRGSFVFCIQSGKQFPINMIDLNDKIDENEKSFMLRLLDVRDVDHDPFALTDQRVVEIERLQSFASLFIKYIIILFITFITTFGLSAGLQDRFNIGYEPAL